MVNPNVRKSSECTNSSKEKFSASNGQVVGKTLTTDSLNGKTDNVVKTADSNSNPTLCRNTFSTWDNFGTGHIYTKQIYSVPANVFLSTVNFQISMTVSQNAFSSTSQTNAEYTLYHSYFCVVESDKLYEYSQTL